MRSSRVVFGIRLLVLVTSLWLAWPLAAAAQGPTTADLPLKQGWNLVSLPLVPESTDPATIFAPIAGSTTQVWTYTSSPSGGQWKGYGAGTPNDLTELNETMGFWIEVTADVTLPVTGTEPSGATITLYSGRNLVGYPHTISRPAALVLDGVSHESVLAYDPTDPDDPWKQYDPDAPSFANDLTRMERGKGYWVDVPADASYSLPPLLPVEDHCGAISVDATWEGDVVHRVTCDVTVSAGVTLTVEAGAVVKFSSYGNELEVYGTLDAQGTVGRPVYFTSILDDSVGGDTNGGGASSPYPGSWRRIYIAEGASATLSHSVVRYGGYWSMYNPDDPMIDNYGSLTLTNCDVRHSTQEGIISQNGSLSITNCTIADNDLRGILVYGQPLTLVGSTIINNGSNGLTFDESGAPEDLILLDNVFNGNGGYAAGINAAGTGENFFADLTTFNGNSGSGNAHDAIVFSGNITGTTVLAPQTGLVYVFGGAEISSGSSLTLEPGVVVKFSSYVSELEVYGTLDAQGTAESPIYLTSYLDDSVGGDTNGGGASSPYPGSWRRIYIAEGANATLSHTVVRYGGYWSQYNPDDPMIDNYGSLTLTNCDVRYSTQEGIISQNGALSITNSTIADNNLTGILVYGQPLTLVGSTIINNGSNGLGFDESGAPEDLVLLNNVFNGNGGYAAAIHADSPGESFFADLTTFNGNSGSGNAHDAIILSGTISGTTVLAPQEGLVYVFGGTEIDSGSSLTVRPGTVVKLASYIDELEVYGSLDTQGTAENPVIFTSYLDDTYGGDTNGDGPTSPYPGNWKRIYIAAGATATLTHTVVRYGGYWSQYNPDDPMIDNYGSLTLDNCDVRYSTQEGIISQNGSLSVTDSTIADNDLTGLAVHDLPVLGPLTLLDNVFSSNGGYAATIRANEPGEAFFADLTTFSGNSGSGNTHDAISLSGNISGTTVLGPQGDLVYVFGDSEITAGNSLTLEAGTIVKFHSSLDELKVQGTLNALGTAESPIYFTSYQDDSVGGDTNGDGPSTPYPEDWTRIHIAENGYASLTHTVIRYGGYWSQYGPKEPMISNEGSLALDHCDVRYSRYHGIGSTKGTLHVADTTVQGNRGDGVYSITGSLHISDTTVQGNTGDGIYASPTLTNALSLHRNSLMDNGGTALKVSVNHVDHLSGNSGEGNGVDGISLSVTGGGYSNRIHVTRDTTWPANPLPFTTWGISEVVVDEGVTLTLDSGVVVKLSHTSEEFQIDGVLTASGTSERPIVFTSIRDDFHGGDTINDGGGTAPARGDWRRIHIGATGSASLDHCVVQYAEDGIYSEGASLSITGSTIAHNEHAGVWAKSDATISQSNIYNNGNYGVLNSSGLATVDARYNWWGSDSGPTPYGSANGINYTTSCSEGVCSIIPYVDADPWLGKEYWVGHHLGQEVAWNGYEAEPVNTANGNYTYAHTDLSIPTRALPLDFIRAYNSLDSQPAPLGYGWTHNWNLYLTENPDDGSVVVTFGDGHAEKWTWTGTAYDGAPGVFGTLVKNGDSSFDLTEKDQTRYHFDAQGRLAWAEDNNGNRTTLTFDAQGRLTAVTEPAGRALTFAYTSPISDTLISSVADSLIRSIQFTYNITGELTTITDVMGYTTTMTYDADHRLLSITDANGHTFVRNVYDDRGRVKEQYDALNNKTTFAYDEPDHKTLVTDPRGYTTVYQYDSEWRLTSEKDALDQTISYSYDEDNNRTAVADRRGNTAYYAYDDRGNVTIITDTLGYTTTMAYDDKNNLTQHRDRLGRVTHYTYDANGNLTQAQDPLSGLTHYAYYSDPTRNGLPQSGTDAEGRVTSYDYDTLGHLTVITNALGNAMTFTYDNVGRKLSETDPLGRTTHYAYDIANRLTVITNTLGFTTVSTYDAVGNRIAVQDALGRVTQYGYDAKDRLAVITDTLGNATLYAYDANDNRTSVTDANGNTTTFTYDALNRLASMQDPLGNVTSYTYDANGNRTSLTDANDHTTSYTYDELNRPIQVTDALGHTTTYTYDGAGNKTAMTDANGNTTTYSYNALNRLISVTDPLGGVTSYTYDAVGNRTAITDANNHTTTFGYDAANRLISVTNTLSHTTSYSYDAVGNRTSMTDANGHTTAYAYDALNRLASTTDPPGNITTSTYDAVGNRIGVTDANGNMTSYTYDGLNRLITVTDALSGTVTYTYDAVDNKASLSDANGHQTNYAYDAADRLISVTDPLSHTTIYSYDGVGNKISVLDPNGNTTTYSYDALNRVTRIAYPDATVDYAYDGLGNRVVMTDTIGVSSYTYDALNRLSSVTYPHGRVMSYSYDAVGNRTGISYPDGKQVTYAYDDDDQLSVVTDWSGGVFTYCYGAAGNLTGLANPNGTRSDYVYDDANRLTGLVNTSVVSGTLSTHEYELDGVGNRVIMTDTHGTTGYTYDELHRLMNVAYPDGESVTYQYEAMGNRTAMTSTVSGAITYTYDAGDRLLTVGGEAVTWDDNGNMLSLGPASFSYNAGNRLTQVISGTTTVRFTYDGDGNRIRRDEGGATTEYLFVTFAGLPQVLVETSGGDDTLYVFGLARLAMELPDSSRQYYHADGLGSIIGLTDDAGKLTTAYTYDAFGSVRSVTGSDENAFTFTGEQADPSLHLVYLRARWYDPTVGRFLTRDPIAGYDASPQTLNRYVYVHNNPMNLVDPSGYWVGVDPHVYGAGIGLHIMDWEIVPEVFASSVSHRRAIENLPAAVNEAREDFHAASEEAIRQGRTADALVYTFFEVVAAGSQFSLKCNPASWIALDAAKKTAQITEVGAGVVVGTRDRFDVAILAVEIARDLAYKKVASELFDTFWKDLSDRFPNAADKLGKLLGGGPGVASAGGEQGRPATNLLSKNDLVGIRAHNMMTHDLFGELFKRGNTVHSIDFVDRPGTHWLGRVSDWVVPLSKPPSGGK